MRCGVRALGGPIVRAALVSLRAGLRGRLGDDGVSNSLAVVLQFFHGAFRLFAGVRERRLAGHRGDVLFPISRDFNIVSHVVLAFLHI